jgi:phosphatidylserine/phosphatidylglycerophosphate/cardiolipin synthase-like enzyme
VSRPYATVLFLLVLLGSTVAGSTPTGPATSLGSARPPGSPAASADPASGADAPALVALYPNPHAAGDAGEFVVVEVPPGSTLVGVRLCDGERCVALPDGVGRGRLVLTAAPDRVRNLTEDTVAPLAAGLDLANDGERVTLIRNGTVVSTVRYDRAPEGELLVRSTSGEGSRQRWSWRWRPLGATDRPIVSGGPAAVEAFVLPDAPAVPLATLDAAEDRLYLAAYTFASARVVDALVRARERGVRVRVLVEGAPVGGTSVRQAAALDRLVRAGIEVRAVGGPWARYRFQHAKYAVVDDRALVTTENWKPAGVGGRASRGWGAVIHDEAIAAGLAATFRADWTWRDAIPWETFRRGRSFVVAPPANGTFPVHVTPERVEARSIRLLAAPDNAEPAVRSLLDGANETLDVLQVTLGGPDGPFTRALVRAARRGVEVRVLLSSAWYVREENRALADRLNAAAEREGVPLTVALTEPGGRFEKIHAKGVVVDGRAVLLGSLNFNAHSARENREVAVVLSGAPVAGYFGDVFEADWRGRGGREVGTPLPAGLVAALGVALLVALVLAGRIEFER